MLLDFLITEYLQIWCIRIKMSMWMCQNIASLDLKIALKNYVKKFDVAAENVDKKSEILFLCNLLLRVFIIDSFFSFF